MSLFKKFMGLAVATGLFFSFGCGVFDNGEGEDPQPMEEFPAEVRTVPEDWGPGSGESSIGGESSLAGGDLDMVPGLNFPVIYFGYDTEKLSPSENAKLDKVADYLKQHGILFLIIEGHCDQRGTEEYNRALGERRANMIRKSLNDRGVEDSRLRTVSYGKDRPAVDGANEAAWGKNRRGELLPAKKK